MPHSLYNDRRADILAKETGYSSRWGSIGGVQIHYTHSVDDQRRNFEMDPPVLPSIFQFDALSHFGIQPFDAVDGTAVGHYAIDLDRPGRNGHFYR